MTKLFYKCEVLQAVPGIGGWDMSNVETMFAMFARAYKLKTLDVSNWNTSSVTSLYAMFQMCFDLEYLDVADWDVSKVTDFSFLFKGTGNKGDMKINNLDVSKWDTSSAKTFQCMFYGCAQITELDLSTWKTDNLEDMSHMFADCYKLEKISFAGWNTPKLNTIDALFNNCESLKSVDVSDLDTANVVEFSQAFEYCYRLEKIIGLDKWVTTSGQDFGEMFSSCGSLKELDLSSFDTTNAKDSYVNASNGDGNDRFNAFLSGCNALEKIILGKNFSFDGDGSFTKWTFTMPSSTKVNGWDGKWYTADGTGYLPAAVPEQIAATYYAVKPVNP
jgi:surface protein